MSDLLPAGALMSSAGETDRAAIVDAYQQAFGFTTSRSHTYIDQIGLRNFRVLKQGKEFAAVMAVIEAGHWLGGSPVAAVNIAHVAINPAWRGAGLAAKFLDAVCAEAASRKTGLATLFASTRPVYRRSGFSLAGVEAIYEADTSSLPRARDTKFIRLSGDRIRDAIEPMYDRQCARDAGLLKRGDAHWSTLLANAPSVYQSVADDAPGYVIIDTSNPDCLVVTDWAAHNGKAATHLLTLLGTFSSVYPRIRWHGSAQDALVFAMPDKGWQLVHQEEWMARVLDPTMALQQRGYAADGAVAFELLSATNVIRLALTVSNGRGTCREETDGLPTVRLALGDLGGLLTGHRSARFLARAGIVSGDAEAVGICDTLFAGPAPWVGEHF